MAGVSLRQRWMTYLQSQQVDLKLVQLTIPGTHDTGTWELGPSVSKTQAWTLAEQFDHGVRFVDIRLVPETNGTRNDLKIYHGAKPSSSTDCGVWFSDVVDTCRTFLNDHPGETIVMSVKNEHEGVPPADFVAAFDPFLVTERDQVGNYLFHLNTTVPTLSEAKGKIVLFRRYDYPAGYVFSYPADYPAAHHDAGKLPGIDGMTGWPDDNWTPSATGGSPPLMVQDVYGMACTSKEKKWNDFIRPFLEQAEAWKPRYCWFLNFTSASGGLPPTDFARDINRWLQDWLERRLAEEKSMQFGTVVMDFPSPRTVDLLIAMNLEQDAALLQPLRGYDFTIEGESRGIGPAYFWTTDRWNYAQATTGTKMKHVLVKIDGNVDVAHIYPGDTVLIQSTEFQNDENIYLEGLGYKYYGSQLYYCKKDGYSYGASMVHWVVESGVAGRDAATPFALGEAVMFRNLSTHAFPSADS